MMKKVIIFLLFLLIYNTSFGQDLFAVLDSVETKETREIIPGTFRSVRLINGYNSEIVGNKDLVFSISHRFNSLNTGLYDLFGLDHSTIRFGFEYGLYDRISLGIGRSNFEKLYDGFLKIKIMKQSTGKKSFPVTITLLEGIAVKTLKWTIPEVNYPLTGRISYVHELFIARKFNNQFSAQISPVIIHRNMVPDDDDQNIVSAIGFGGSYRISKVVTISTEYYYLLPGKTADDFQNSLAIGCELETGGGHIFQLNLSNSHGMTEKAFIPETTGKWLDGDIFLGFNIIRVFHAKNKKGRK